MIHKISLKKPQQHRIISFEILGDKVKISSEVCHYGVRGFFAQILFVPGQAPISCYELQPIEKAREIYKIFVEKHEYRLYQEESLVE